MARRETDLDKIIRLAKDKFPYLEGVDARSLIHFILAKKNRLRRSRIKYIGDDARDYMNSSYFLRNLSDKALSEIEHLGVYSIKRRLKEKTFPFSVVNRKDRETLLHLPNSWIHGAAEWILNSSKPK